VGCTSSKDRSNWEKRQEEREWRESEVRLPDYPKRGYLLEFDVGGRTGFRFFVDSTSISIGAEGVVRYVLVAMSPHGAENVSLEGIRCTAEAYKIYATGQRDGIWMQHETDWRPIHSAAVQPWRSVLSRGVFCPGGAAIAKPGEAVDALRRGRWIGLRNPVPGSSAY
jgi:hypothetical protein